MTAINAFTSSLSRRTLVQIETVLLELVSEVRQGRREPSLASLHETHNDSVWRELENELATDGISSTDITKHKAAIKIFIQGLLGENSAENNSLVEIASLIEFDNDDLDSESLSHGSSATNISHEDPAESPIASNAQNGSLVSLDEQQYEIADEEIPPQETGASIPKTVIRHDHDFSDAIAYINKVKVHMLDRFYVFVEILNRFGPGILDLHGAISWISVLFVCNPELLESFTLWVPSRFQTECGTVDNRYAFRVISDSTAYVRIPDLQAMESMIWRRRSPGRMNIYTLGN